MTYYTESDAILRKMQDYDPSVRGYRPNVFNRFGKDKRYWVKVFENTTRNGKPFNIAVIGDHKTGEQITVKETFGEDIDQVVIKRAANQMRKQMVEEIEKQYEDVAQTAQKEFYEAPRYDGISPYLKKKGVFNIEDPLRKEVQAGEYSHGAGFMIPVMDIDGKLWSLQGIFDNGDKLFKPGGKKKGCFHTLQGNSSTVYFVEGYATGLTIYEATRSTVVVCFDSGNLGEVIAAWRRDHRKGDFIIASDEDKWNRVNVGRKKATEAGEQYGCKVVFPCFKDESNKPTDFNDLHCSEGIMEVAKQLNSAETVSRYTIQHKRGADEKEAVTSIGLQILNDKDLITVADMTYKFDGRVWVPLDDQVIDRWAREYDGFNVQSARRTNEIKKMIKAATAQEEKITWRKIKDTWVPFQNGIVDIENDNEMMPHKRDYYLESVLPWDYDGEVYDCPMWYQCLNEWFPPSDPDARAKKLALQMFFGYCLMPHAGYKKALVLYGDSNTGKSVVLTVLREMVGQENTCSIPVEYMDDPRKLEPIKGKILNVINELSSKSLIADAGFKQLISTSDAVQIDPKYKKPYLYKPFAKHVIATNTLPNINDQTMATYNRLLVLQFEQAIPKEKQDRAIEQKLISEMPSIINWALLGAEILKHAHGQFEELESSNRILDEHRRMQNPVSVFIEEECEEHPETKILMPELRKAFFQWYSKPMGVKTFSQLLQSTGFKITQDKGQRIVYGLRLKPKAQNYWETK